MYKTGLEVVNGQISRFTKPCPNKSGRRDPIRKDLLEVVNNRWEFIKSQYCGLQSRPPGAVKAKPSPAHLPTAHPHPSQQLHYTLHSSGIQIGCVHSNLFSSNSAPDSQNWRSVYCKSDLGDTPPWGISVSQNYSSVILLAGIILVIETKLFEKLQK